MQKIDQNALNHRSIRAYQDEPLSEQTMMTLEQVAQATATSKFMQQFSLIRITDAALKKKVAAITTYAYVDGPATLYLFVVDHARNVHLVEDSHADLHQLTNWDAFLGGVFDASLAAQNMVAAAERSGLGSVYLGSVLNDPAALIQLFDLPRYTFPLLGLLIGVPAEKPEVKPRLPHETVVGVNGYPAYNAEAIRDYDTTVKTYYKNRGWNQREQTYTDSMVAHLKTDLHHRDEIGRILRQQGFILPQ